MPTKTTSKKTTSTPKKHTSVAKYVYNVGKSIGYSTIDVVKNSNPFIVEFVEENADLAKIAYETIKDFKGSLKKGKNYALQSKVGEFAIQYKKSLFEDLKSGNWYNKEREQQLNLKALGSSFEDDGDWDLGDDDSWLKDDSTDFNADDDNDWNLDDMLEGEEAIASNSVNAINNATVRSAEYVAKSNASALFEMQKHNEALFGKLNLNVGAVNASIGSVLNILQQSLPQMLSTSVDFYNRSLELDKERNDVLKQILETQSKMITTMEASNSKGKDITRDDIVSGGVPNLKQYAKKILQNANALSMGVGDIGSMLGEDSNALLAFASSPLKGLSDMVAKKIIPNTIKKSMEQINNSMTGFFDAFINKMNYEAKNNPDTIAGIVGKLFGIETNIKNSIDTSKYTKGPLPYDGVSKQALTVVLPSYLAKIESFLTGNPERLYDYDTGRFVNGHYVKQRHLEDIASITKNSAADLIKSFEEALNNFVVINGKDVESSGKATGARKREIVNAFQSVLRNSVENGTYLDINNSENTWGIDSDNEAIIKGILRGMSKSSSGRSAILNFERKNNEAKSAFTKKMKDLEARGGGILSYLFNDFGIGEYSKVDEKGHRLNGVDRKDNYTSFKEKNKLSLAILDQEDGYGYNVFDYLRNIDTNISTLVDTGIGVSIGVGGKVVTPTYKGKSNTTSRASRLDTRDSRYLVSRSDINRKETENYEKQDISEFKRLLKANKFLSKDGTTILSQGLLYNLNDIDSSWDVDKIARNIAAVVHDAQEREEFEAAFDLNKAKRDNPKGFERLNQWFMNSDRFSDETKKLFKGLKTAAGAPAKGVSSIIDTVDRRMFEFIYGTDPLDSKGVPDSKSFLGQLTANLTLTFSTFGDFLKDNILEPIKEGLGLDESKREEKKSKAKEFIKNMTGIDMDDVTGSIVNIMESQAKKKLQYVKDSFKSPRDTLLNFLMGNPTELKGEAEDILSNLYFSEYGVKPLNFADAEKVMDIFHRRGNYGSKEEEETVKYYQSLLDKGYNVDWKRFISKTKYYKNGKLDRNADPKAVRAEADRLRKQAQAIYGNYENRVNEEKKASKLLASKISANPQYSFDEFQEDVLKENISIDPDRLQEIYRILSKGKYKDGGKMDLFRQLKSQGMSAQDIIEYRNKKKYEGISNKRDDYNRLVGEGIPSKVASLIVNKIKPQEYGNFVDLYNKAASAFPQKDPAQIFNLVYRKFGGTVDSATLSSLDDNTRGKDAFSRLYNFLSENGAAFDRDAYYNMSDDEIKDYFEITNRGFASGARTVNKTGLAILSEGEMVIPAKYNPYYHGVSDTYKQAMKENRIGTKYKSVLKNLGKNGVLSSLPSYAEGAQSVNTDLTGEDQKKIEKILASGNRNGEDYQIISTIDANGDEQHWLNYKGKRYRIFKDGNGKYSLGYDQDFRDKENGAIYRTSSKIGDIAKGIRNFFSSRKKGKHDSPEAKKVFGESQKLFDNMIDDITTNSKVYFPEMFGGAGVGLGASLITGLFNPILGLAAGAGIGLVTSSDKVRSWLFGEYDEQTGKRTGNIISADLANNIEKYLPGMAKSATVGAITSLLPVTPYGPVSGIILGSAIGFAKNNESFMNTLFGTAILDENGNMTGRQNDGLISQEFIKKLKDTVPEMGIGSIAGALTLPFGLIPNIFIGAGLGFATTTDAFKNAMFGKEDPVTHERSGGIVGALKTGFVDPLKEFAFDLKDNFKDWWEKGFKHPISEALKPLGKQLSLIGGRIGSFFNKLIGGDKEDSFKVTIGKRTRNLANRGFNLVKGVTGAALRPVTAIAGGVVRGITNHADKLRYSQIMDGDADYLSAEERLAYRDKYEENYRNKRLFGNTRANLVNTFANPVNIVRDIGRGIYNGTNDVGRGYESLGNSSNRHARRAFTALNTAGMILNPFGTLIARGVLGRAADRDNLGYADIRGLDGADLFRSADETIAAMSSSDVRAVNDQLQRLKKAESMSDKNVNIAAAKSEAINEINTLLNDKYNLRISDISAITSDLNRGDINNAHRRIRRLSYITEAQRNAIVGEINASWSKYNMATNISGNFATARKETLKKLREAGFKNITEKNLSKYADYFKKEADARGPLQEDKEDKRHGEIVSLFTQLINEVKMIGATEEEANKLKEESLRSARDAADRNLGAIFDTRQRDKYKQDVKIYRRGEGVSGVETRKTSYAVEEVDENGNPKSGYDFETKESVTFKMVTLHGEQKTKVSYGDGRYAIVDTDHLINKTGGVVNGVPDAPDNETRTTGSTTGGRSSLFRFGARGFKNKVRDAWNFLGTSKAERAEQFGYSSYRDFRSANRKVKSLNKAFSKGQLTNARVITDDNGNFIRYEQLDPLGREAAELPESDRIFEQNGKQYCYQFNGDKALRFVNNGSAESPKWEVDMDDKETKDNVQKMRDEKDSKLPGLFKGIWEDSRNLFNRLFLINSERDSFLKKVFKVASISFSFMTATGFIKPVGDWFEGKVIPKFKTWLEPIKPMIAKAAIGLDNAISKIPDAISRAFENLHKFLTGDFGSRLVGWYAQGLNRLATLLPDILPPIVVNTVKSLGALAKGAGKAAWDLLTTPINLLTSSTNNVDTTNAYTATTSYLDNLSTNTKNNGVFSAVVGNFLGDDYVNSVRQGQAESSSKSYNAYDAANDALSGYGSGLKRIKPFRSRAKNKYISNEFYNGRGTNLIGSPYARYVGGASGITQNTPLYYRYGSSEVYYDAACTQLAPEYTVVNGNIVGVEEFEEAAKSSPSLYEKLTKYKNTIGGRLSAASLRAFLTHSRGAMGISSVLRNAVKKTKPKGLILRVAKKVTSATLGAGDLVFNAGKLGKSIASTATDVALVVDKVTLRASINGKLSKIFNNKLVSKLFSKFGKNSKEIVSKLSGKLTDLVASSKKVASKAAGAFRIFGNVLNIALAVKDFISGYNNAPNILGILRDDTTTGYKLACGITKAILNVLTFGLLDFDSVITLVIETLGVAPEEYLDSLRVKAAAYIRDLNALYGTNITLEEYNDSGSWTKKLWNKITGKTGVKIPSGPAENDTPSYRYEMFRKTGDPSYLWSGMSSAAAGLASSSGIAANGFVVPTGDVISQLDKQYKFMPFIGSRNSVFDTVGNSGCGPAAAAMAINRISGKNISYTDALNYASDYKEGTSGVNASYFDSIYNRMGLRAEYNENPYNNTEDMLSRGSVVLLGQHTGNMSKANSPFGPKPHYVVADAIRGNSVIIRDPEQGYARNYPKSILKKANLAIGFGNRVGSSLNTRYAKYAGGASALRNSNKRPNRFLRRFRGGSSGLKRFRGGDSGVTYKLKTITQAALSAIALTEVGNAYYFDYGCIVDDDTNGYAAIGILQWNDRWHKGTELVRKVMRANTYQSKAILGTDLYNAIMNYKSSSKGEGALSAEFLASHQNAHSKISELIGHTDFGKKAQMEFALADVTKYLKMTKTALGTSADTCDPRIYVFIPQLINWAGVGAFDNKIKRIINGAIRDDKISNFEKFYAYYMDHIDAVDGNETKLSSEKSKNGRYPRVYKFIMNAVPINIENDIGANDSASRFVSFFGESEVSNISYSEDQDDNLLTRLFGAISKAAGYWFGIKKYTKDTDEYSGGEEDYSSLIDGAIDDISSSYSDGVVIDSNGNIVSVDENNSSEYDHTKFHSDYKRIIGILKNGSTESKEDIFSKDKNFIAYLTDSDNTFAKPYNEALKTAVLSDDIDALYKYLSDNPQYAYSDEENAERLGINKSSLPYMAGALDSKGYNYKYPKFARLFFPKADRYIGPYMEHLATYMSGMPISESYMIGGRKNFWNSLRSLGLTDEVLSGKIAYKDSDSGKLSAAIMNRIFLNKYNADRLKNLYDTAMKNKSGTPEYRSSLYAEYAKHFNEYTRLRNLYLSEIDADITDSKHPLYEKYSKYANIIKNSESSLSVGQEGPAPFRLHRISNSSGKGSGFISQLDPRIAHTPFGKSTIGEAGCGPASAAMAINDMIAKQSARGLSMGDASNIASKYVDSTGGVTADYFGDVFSRYGASADYSTSKSKVTNDLKAGKDVVLLGRDSSNTSKANSPFGPNNHYVLARGISGNKVLINDPELSGPRVYDKSILNSTKLGISVSGRASGVDTSDTDGDSKLNTLSNLIRKLGNSWFGIKSYSTKDTNGTTNSGTASSGGVSVDNYDGDSIVRYAKSYANELGLKIITLAASLIGKLRYKYGAKDVPNGVSDCSGFTAYVYQRCGVTVTGGSMQQLYQGYPIDPSELKIGDLIIFKGTNTKDRTVNDASHVGIYSGRGADGLGRFIHLVGSGCKESVLFGSEWKKHFMCARRVFDQTGAKLCAPGSVPTSAKTIKLSSSASKVSTVNNGTISSVMNKFSKTMMSASGSAVDVLNRANDKFIEKTMKQASEENAVKSAALISRKSSGRGTSLSGGASGISSDVGNKILLALSEIGTTLKTVAQNSNSLATLADILNALVELKSLKSNDGLSDAQGRSLNNRKDRLNAQASKQLSGNDISSIEFLYNMLGPVLQD